jgi:hypothetical protein
MLLRTIYERIQMNRIVNLKENRAERHACASSNICRMAYAITVLTPTGAKKNVISVIQIKLVMSFIRFKLIMYEGNVRKNVILPVSMLLN